MAQAIDSHMPQRTKDCERCGNPIPITAVKCRFCEALQTGVNAAPMAAVVRTIDLEAGMPTVEEAMRRLDSKLSLAIAQNVRVVRVIHGYGSSGRGGKIRDACRRALASMVGNNQVRAMIRGEDHSAASLASQELIRRIPDLKSSTRTDADNPGITLVEL
jgi:hypothetical protein